MDYIIDGGEEGKNRLNVLAGVLEPYTRSLLEKLGVKEGTHFLDNGCGGGNVAIMAAKIVGEPGHVTGLDLDANILALAAKDAGAQGLKNISFHTLGANDVTYNAEFDIAYARFLLSHLTNPLDALLRMRHSVKHGGIVVAEDVQFSGHFSYPANDAFNQYLEWYALAVQQKGADAETGVKLFSLFKQAGIADVHFDVIQPAFNKGDGKWMAYITLDRIKHTLIQTGLANEAAVNAVLAALETFTKDNDTIISLPRIHRVWGYRRD